MISTDGLKRLEDRYAKLESEAMTWRSHVQECFEFAKPRKANVTSKRTPGGKNHQRVYDGHAEWCADVYAAGIASGVTPADTQIVRMYPAGTNAQDDHDAKLWTEEVGKQMHMALDGSNFQTISHEGYVDSIAGQFCLYIEEDEKDMTGEPSFRCIKSGNYVIAEDSKGRVDTLIRKYEATPRQIAQDWPNHGNREVSEALEAETYDADKQMVVYHAVYPREERNASKKDPQNRKFASVYWIDSADSDDRTLLEESGYFEFPYVVVRVSRDDGPYGRGPAMKALADIKTLQEQERTNMRSAQKRADPSIMVPSEGILGDIRIGAKSINYYDPNKFTGTRLGPVTEMPGGGDPSFSLEMQDRKREAIERAFFVDVFRSMPRHADMRVDQVLEIKAEAMRQLGPFLGRLQADYLQPLFERIFGILWRAGQIAPPPDSIRGSKMRFEFISPLFRGYRSAEEVEGIAQAFAFADGRFQITQDPSIYDNLDADEALRITAMRFNTPSKVLKSEKMVEESRAQRAQAQQAEQERADMAQTAENIGRAGPALAKMGMGGANAVQ